MPANIHVTSQNTPSPGFAQTHRPSYATFRRVPATECIAFNLKTSEPYTQVQRTSRVLRMTLPFQTSCQVSPFSLATLGHISHGAVHGPPSPTNDHSCRTHDHLPGSMRPHRLALKRLLRASHRGHPNRCVLTPASLADLLPATQDEGKRPCSALLQCSFPLHASFLFSRTLLAVQAFRYVHDPGGASWHVHPSRFPSTAGATGLVGSRLASKLASQGHKVRVLARDVGKARSKLPYPGLEFFAPGQWSQAIAGSTGIANLAGEPIATRCAAPGGERPSAASVRVRPGGTPEHVASRRTPHGGVAVRVHHHGVCTGLPRLWVRKGSDRTRSEGTFITNS